MSAQRNFCFELLTNLAFIKYMCKTYAAAVCMLHVACCMSRLLKLLVLLPAAAKRVGVLLLLLL